MDDETFICYECGVVADVGEGDGDMCEDCFDYYDNPACEECSDPILSVAEEMRGTCDPCARAAGEIA